MSIFKYTAINSAGKKLIGSVESLNENNARNELNKLGFSIIDLKEIKENTQEIQKNHQLFIFEAKDKSGKEIKGSIPSLNKQTAIKRLNKEYNLKVIAIYPENADKKTIEEARNIETQSSNIEESRVEEEKEFHRQHQHEAEFLKDKIDFILKKVNKLLEKYNNELNLESKNQIDTKIKKLLRIKNSYNLELIHSTAKDLLEFLQKQENKLEEKGYKDKKFEFSLETSSLISELNKKEEKKSLSEDIAEKIEKLKQINTKQNKISNYTNKILQKIEKTFKESPEVIDSKHKIKELKKEKLSTFLRSIKERNKSYKEKLKENINQINTQIKQEQNKIDQLKGKTKKIQETTSKKRDLKLEITNEIRNLSGAILIIHLIYYFIAYILSTKNIGLLSAPKGFYLYESHSIKYIILIVFLAHILSSIKLQFLKENKSSYFLFPIIFFIISILSIINF